MKRFVLLIAAAGLFVSAAVSDAAPRRWRVYDGDYEVGYVGPGGVTYYRGYGYGYPYYGYGGYGGYGYRGPVVVNRGYGYGGGFRGAYGGGFHGGGGGFRGGRR